VTLHTGFTRTRTLDFRGRSSELTFSQTSLVRLSCPKVFPKIAMEVATRNAGGKGRGEAKPHGVILISCPTGGVCQAGRRAPRGGLLGNTVFPCWCCLQQRPPPPD